jgi:hypothetical protein
MGTYTKTNHGDHLYLDGTVFYPRFNPCCATFYASHWDGEHEGVISSIVTVIIQNSPFSNLMALPCNAAETARITAPISRKDDQITTVRVTVSLLTPRQTQSSQKAVEARQAALADRHDAR